MQKMSTWEPRFSGEVGRPVVERVCNGTTGQEAICQDIHQVKRNGRLLTVYCTRAVKLSVAAAVAPVAKHPSEEDCKVVLDGILTTFGCAAVVVPGVCEDLQAHATTGNPRQAQAIKGNLSKLLYARSQTTTVVVVAD